MPLVSFWIDEESGSQSMIDGHREYKVTAYGLNTDPMENIPTMFIADRLLKESVPLWWGADINAVLVDINPTTHKQVHNGMIWKFDLTYSTKREKEKEEEEEVRYNPTKQPAKIIPGYHEMEVHSLVAYGGDTVTTTAGEFLTGFTKKVGCNRYSITKNVEWYGALPEWWQTHKGAVNKDEVTILGITYKPLTLKCTFTGSEVKEKFGIKYFEVYFDVLENPLEWRYKTYNMGVYESTREYEYVKQEPNEYTPNTPILVQVGWSFKRINDDTGQSVTDPVPLTDEGIALRELVENKKVKPPSKKWILKRQVNLEKDCLLLDFADHREESFAVLPLT